MVKTLNCLLQAGVTIKPMWLKKTVFFILIIPLLGFTSSDRESYRILYDVTKFNATDVFSEIEWYAKNEGFQLETKIQESFPDKKIISEFRYGVPYQGGVFLIATLSNEDEINLEAIRLVGGCSSSHQKIEEVERFKSGLYKYLKDNKAIEVEIQKTNEP